MHNKKNGLSLKTTTALIIIMFLLGFGGTMLYYAFYHVAYIKFYPINIEVSEYNLIGFNADPTLDFGKIPVNGGTARKELNLWNDWDIPLRVQIRIRGDAAQFITVANNSFVMQPDEHKKVNFYASIPSGAELRNITGTAKIIYFRT